jgi:L-ribulose-5-phosphate 3-epimerase
MMKTYQLGLYEKAMPNHLSFKDKLKITKQAGFDFLELSIDETDDKLKRLDWTDAEIYKIKHIMEIEQVFIQSICLSGHRKYPLGSQSEEIQKRSLEIMEKAILLAHRLGVRYIQIAGYDEYYLPSSKETKRLFQKNLIQSVHMAATYGVILAFETMETPFMNTITKAMKYVEDIDSPYLKVYPDMGNLTNAYDANIQAIKGDIRRGKGHIVAAHLKETKPGIFRNMTFGTGHTNHQACIKELLKQHVYLFVGEFWYNDKRQWRKNIDKSYHFLKHQIEGAMKS